MSDQNPDYADIRHSVETQLSRQKWLYRIVFFLTHLLFFVVSMLIVWGVIAANPQIRDVLFNPESGAGIIVFVPTILWGMGILFHIASLYFESKAGEQAMRERLFMREAGKDFLAKAYAEDKGAEKPKRGDTAPQDRHLRLSIDGELVAVDDDPTTERGDLKFENKA